MSHPSGFLSQLKRPSIRIDLLCLSKYFLLGYLTTTRLPSLPSLSFLFACFFFCKNDAVEGGYSIPPSVPSFVDVFFCVGPPFANDRVDVDDQVAVLLAQVLALSHLCVCVCATLSPAIGFRPTIAEENRVETDWKKKQEDLELNFRLTDVIAIIECGVCGVCVRRFPCRRLDCVESTVDRSEQKLKIEIKKQKKNRKKEEENRLRSTGLAW